MQTVKVTAIKIPAGQVLVEVISGESHWNETAMEASHAEVTDICPNPYALKSPRT